MSNDITIICDQPAPTEPGWYVCYPAGETLPDLVRVCQSFGSEVLAAGMRIGVVPLKRVRGKWSRRLNFQDPTK